MNPGGIVVAVIGVWLGCQVFAGDFLERLRITNQTTVVAGHGTPAVATGGSIVRNA